MINTFLSLHLALLQNSHMGPRGFQFIEQNGINFNISYSCGVMLGDSGQKWNIKPLCFFCLWLVQGWNHFPEEMFLSPGTNPHVGQVNQDLQHSWKWGEQEERTKYYQANLALLLNHIFSSIVSSYQLPFKC